VLESEGLTFRVDKNQGLAFGESPGSLFPSFSDNSLNRTAGNTHSDSGFFLGQSFEIAES